MKSTALKFFRAGKTYLYRINRVKVKICKKVLKEVCINFDGAKDFINSKIKEICSRERLSVNEGKSLWLTFVALKMVICKDM